MDLTTLFLLIINIVILGLVAKWLYNRVKSKLDEVEDHEIVRDGDYALDERARSINLTDQGSVKIEKRLADLLVDGTSLFDYDFIIYSCGYSPYLVFINFCHKITFQYCP